MNLLITGAWSDAKKHIPTLEAMGHAVAFMQWENDTIPCDYDWVEGIVCNNLFASHPIDRFPRLRYIQLTSAGYDRVPMDIVAARGITIRNARGVYSIPMAEFAVTSVLYFYKSIRAFNQSQQQHVWQKQRNVLELTDKNVVIVGCGSVGQACAKRFSAFGCQVIGVDLDGQPRDGFDCIHSVNNLSNVLTTADVVVLTLPLTDETYHLIDQSMIDLMPNGCVLINIARGAIVNTEALLPRLRSGELFAALDVFETEPLAENDPLWDLDTVLLTPHNSFIGDGNANRLSQVILDSLQLREIRKLT